ncbi:Alcohol dehydrogenase protein [Dioscorea alata]|uniref:Alcohol dehydrogenase protein n=1 Tax=Dioscorea alata TaxID=55571 RepID=A0ACB7VXL4_DIOAL|nr:Alcohol dehydrogenase protein [Dioscorea alata]
MGNNKSMKSIRCKAAVIRGAGEPLQIEEVEVAIPSFGEVRIKIICSSLCHSDITFSRLKDFPGVYPRILGHEAFGVVESVGEGVDEFKVGDSVVPVFLAQCRDCVDCRESQSNLCSKFKFGPEPGMPRDGTTRFTCSDGSPIHHTIFVSSFVEYTVVDAVHLVKVDSRVPPQIACLLSCGVSTGISAAWKVAGVGPGSGVAIFGLGAVGLAVAEGARLRGATKIIGVDLNPAKFETGKKFGLTDFINPNEIGGRPVHEGWGKTVILGVEMHGSPLAIDARELLYGKSIIGSVFGGTKPKEDIPILAKKYLDKELNLEDFITHEVNFQDINKAFDLLLQGKSLRCTIWMDNKKGL